VIQGVDPIQAWRLKAFADCEDRAKIVAIANFIKPLKNAHN
jgi:hypothetical protein